MHKTKTLIGKKPYFYKLNQVEGYDINTPLEFSFAEHLFVSKFYCLLTSMNSNLNN